MYLDICIKLITDHSEFPSLSLFLQLLGNGKSLTYMRNNNHRQGVQPAFNICEPESLLSFPPLEH